MHRVTNEHYDGTKRNETKSDFRPGRGCFLFAMNFDECIYTQTHMLAAVLFLVHFAHYVQQSWHEKCTRLYGISRRKTQWKAIMKNRFSASFQIMKKIWSAWESITYTRFERLTDRENCISMAANVK